MQVFLTYFIYTVALGSIVFLLLDLFFSLLKFWHQLTASKTKAQENESLSILEPIEEGYRST